MAALLNTSRLVIRPMGGLSDSTPPRRCMTIMSGVHIGDRRSIPTHANMQRGGQVPAGTPCVSGHQLPCRPMRPQPLRHQSQCVPPAGHAPSLRRGHLLVVHSSFLDRVSRLKKAYVEFYSDATVSVAKDSAISLEELTDYYHADDNHMFEIILKVSSSADEVRRQICTAVANVKKWTQRAEAAALIGTGSDVLHAAKRRRACQETVDKLQVRLAQNESASDILLGTRLVMLWKVLGHNKQTPASKVRFVASKAKRALKDVPGRALLEPTPGQALTASELRRKHAEAEIVAAELSRHVLGHIDMAADDALEQRFPVLDDSELEELRRRASA